MNYIELSVIIENCFNNLNQEIILYLKNKDHLVYIITP